MFRDVDFIVRVFFPSLRVGDLQVAVCGLEAFPGHNLLFKLIECDMEPIESDCVVVQFGRKLIVNTRHFYRAKHVRISSTGEKNTGLVKTKQRQH